MKIKLLIVIIASFLFSCSRVTPPSEDLIRPRILQNFTDTTELEHVNGAVFYTTKDSSLVYSRYNSFVNVTNQINTLQTTKLNLSGGNLTGRTNIIVGTDGYRLGIMKSAGVAQNGATSLGASSTYLQLGGGEWNVNSYRMIGFGYVSPLTNHPPAQIGYQETSKSSNTLGDLVFATRSTTGNDIPTIRFRIVSGGNVQSYGPINNLSDVATKGYVDTAYMPVKQITFSGTYKLDGTPSNTFIANNANAANTISLPLAKNGIQYTFWKIGNSVMTLTGNIVDAGKNGSKVVSGTETGSSISVTCVGTSWIITAKNGSWTTQ